MACIKIGGRGFVGYICGLPLTFRLPLADGRRVFMEWRNYPGPEFFLDKNCNRMIENWFEDEAICDALDWFLKRGKVA